MDTKLYHQYLKYLDTEDKDGLIAYALGLLNENQVTLEQLYLDFITPSLVNFVCDMQDKTICIWKEHTRTSITRTLLECTYPFVAKKKEHIKKINKSVVIVCPTQELHEIGAIIATHFFILAGFNAQYIGANTPKYEIVSAANVLKPDFIALSVTNYYNLVVTKQLTETLRELYPNLKIIVGGQAFTQENALNQVTYDYHMRNTDDIFALAKEVKR